MIVYEPIPLIFFIFSTSSLLRRLWALEEDSKPLSSKEAKAVQSQRYKYDTFWLNKTTTRTICYQSKIDDKTYSVHRFIPFCVSAALSQNHISHLCIYFWKAFQALSFSYHLSKRIQTKFEALESSSKYTNDAIRCFGRIFSSKIKTPYIPVSVLWRALSNL